MKKPKLKKRQKSKEPIEKLGDSFEVGSMKDKDFEIDLDINAAVFQGKKGNRVPVTSIEIGKQIYRSAHNMGLWS